MPLYNPSTGGGGDGANLAVGTVTSTTVQVTSDSGTDATLPAATNAAAGVATAAQVTKLEGVATGATANATDAQLRDRATHTGTQLAATVSDFSTAADARITAQKGEASGLATLDGAGKLTAAQIPDALVGAINYRGTWNATTNSPAIPAAAVGNEGHYYIVGTAGTTTVDGINDWGVTDWIVSNGVTWAKVDNTDAGGGDAATIRATVLTGLSTASAADVEAGSTILEAFGFLQAKWNAVATTIRGAVLTGVSATGTALPAATDTIVEAWSKLLGWAGNLAANVRATVLTGLSTATSTAASATDTILVAIGKLQAQVTLRALAASPSFTGLETHAGTDLFTAAAMGADVIDVTKMRNTKTVPASNPTYTKSAAGSDGQEWGLELTGDTAARTVTIPSSVNVDTGETITTFVMPADTIKVLTFRRKGSVDLVAGVPGMKIMIPFAIETVANGDYTIILKSIWAGAITNVTTKSASGTCTLTAKINTTALGGTANSVSSSEESQAHSATNVVAVGDDIVVTISSNSTCLKLAGNIEMTVY